jgi:hypothetical protein
MSRCVQTFDWYWIYIYTPDSDIARPNIYIFVNSIVLLLICVYIVVNYTASGS